MDEGTRDDSNWREAAIASLQRLSLKDMPSLEILLIDDLASWAFSDDNPGAHYDKNHGAVVISSLLNAVQRASAFSPTRVPVESEEITAARRKVVAGARDLAKADDGLTMLITRLMPAAVNELNANAGQPPVQAYWLYVYSLLALTSGSSGEINETAMRGIMATFGAWDALMADGFRLPWRMRS